MTVMLQREVVERIGALPGGKEYGYLSVLVQLYCEVVPLFDVPPGAFRPAPKVTSSVVRLRTRATPAVAVRDEAFFLTLTQVIFSQRRKTILNNIRAGLDRLGVANVDGLESSLSDCGIDLRRRAETLTIQEISQLAESVGKLKK
jgi:16S rRNA (adenine1518-N6/adenine1519-N6)-dimethyltransferase